ncbi:hypothetical protein E7738_05675 [Pantoea sp. SGAir0430]|uniref:Uncharacterized protein n=1 Tax=Pantoea dispersa TaxID=59814 RepID=A0ABY3A7A4_9GAMM|nr:hypothetical protein F4W08_16845 [Pantoea dispersa]NIG12868.1 hypothetical protein [Pantoea sp. Cy-640]NIG32573.1 hypothetical protein [Pantoea sp. Ap-959]PPC70359.1 hypothetical protein C1Y43_01450 [Pantoea sp. ICBG 828]RVU74767.1 hypothetical protein EKH82_09600 [Pantoea dispersa]
MCPTSNAHSGSNRPLFSPDDALFVRNLILSALSQRTNRAKVEMHLSIPDNKRLSASQVKK